MSLFGKADLIYLKKTPHIFTTDGSIDQALEPPEGYFVVSGGYTISGVNPVNLEASIGKDYVDETGRYILYYHVKSSAFYPVTLNMFAVCARIGDFQIQNQA